MYLSYGKKDLTRLFHMIILYNAAKDLYKIPDYGTLDKHSPIISLARKTL